MPSPSMSMSSWWHRLCLGWGFTCDHTLLNIYPITFTLIGLRLWLNELRNGKSKMAFRDCFFRNSSWGLEAWTWLFNNNPQQMTRNRSPCTVLLSPEVRRRDNTVDQLLREGTSYSLQRCQPVVSSSIKMVVFTGCQDRQCDMLLLIWFILLSDIIIFEMSEALPCQIL